MKKEFYINRMDETLAEIFLNEQCPVNLKMTLSPDSGLINAEYAALDKRLTDNGIDFDLSTSECCGLNDIDLNDYFKKTVHTSSAFEFFDYVFTGSQTVDADVEFTEDCWKIRLNSWR